MYITYHKQIPVPNDAMTIQHQVLNNNIQDFIEERNTKQNSYYYDSNAYYFFIYLDNGDRIDVSLK